MTAVVGQPAPAFELFDQDRNRVSLDDLAGKKSLVVFIPFPFTGNCDSEGCALRDGLGQLEEMDANVVVITAHAVPTNKKWAEVFGFTFPILSDYWPHGEVTRVFGAFNEAVGAAMRATYVLDEDGVVRDVIATESLSIPREHEAQVEALAKIG